jgi:hypothetical protein
LSDAICAEMLAAGLYYLVDELNEKPIRILRVEE